MYGLTRIFLGQPNIFLARSSARSGRTRGLTPWATAQLAEGGGATVFMQAAKAISRLTSHIIRCRAANLCQSGHESKIQTHLTYIGAGCIGD